MATTIGTLVAFDAKAQIWEEYCEILEQFFAANEITDAARQRAVLISVVGPTTYSLMRSLLSPMKPKDKSYEESSEIVKRPLPSEA